MRRYLETLFRYKEVFLIPALAMPLVALVLMLSAGRQYEISASIWVEPSPLLEPAARSRVAPNEFEAQTLREQLETKAFRREIMDRIGLTDAIMRGAWPVPSRLQEQVNSQPLLAAIPGVQSGLRQLGLVPPSSTDEAVDRGLLMVRRSISVDTERNNLMRITYVGGEPEIGKRIVDETIRLSNEKTLQLRAEETKAGTEFYTRQVRLQEEKLRQAGSALSSFLELHPEPFPGQTRPPSEVAELETLRRTYAFEQTLYDSSVRQLETARVAGEASIAGRIQGFRVIDPPEQPDTAGYTMRAIAIVGIVGVTLGLALGLIPIVLMTWLDNTVRTREDLEGVIEAPVVAQIPRVERRRNQIRDFLRAVLARGPA